MTRSRPTIIATLFSLPLLAGLIVLAFANGGTPVAQATLGVQDCNVNTAGNATVTFDPESAPTGTTVNAHLVLTADTPISSDREVEVIWDSDLPYSGSLAGENFIPSLQSAADVSFSVPGGISGSHDLALCWDNSGTGDWRNVEVGYYVEPSIQCDSPTGTDAELTADSPVPAGGNGNAALRNIPLNPYEDQYLQIILDRTGPDPVLVGENIILADDSDIDTSFYLPYDVPAGTHTLTACWYFGDGWYGETVDIEVTRPEVFSSCGIDGDLVEYGAAGVMFTPPSPNADDDFTAHISNVIVDLFGNQYTEFLWNWDHVPNDALMTNGFGHIPQDQSSGAVDGWIPVDPQPGDVLTICWFHTDEDPCPDCEVVGTWYYKDVVWPFGPVESPIDTSTPVEQRTPRLPTPTGPSTPILTAPATEPVTEPPVTEAPTPTPTATPTATPVVTEPPTQPPTATPAPTEPSVTIGPPITITPIVTPAPTAPPTESPTASPPTASPTAPPVTESPTTPAASPTAVSASQGPVFFTAQPQGGGVGASPTNTPTPTPSRSPSPTPPHSPTPTALAEHEDPGGGTGDPSSLPFDPSNGAARPEWVQGLPTITHVNGDVSVILTNIALGGLSLMLLFLSAEIFNQTIEENEDDIKRTARRYFGPVLAIGEGIGRIWDSMFGERHLLATLAAAPIILTLAALIYLIEMPGAGFNNQTLVLVLSILISVGFLTYAFDGLQVLLAKGQGVNAVLRLFPVGIFVAAFCVAFSRLDGIQPGLIYGFIAASVVVGERKLTREQDGLNVFIPVMLMLAVSTLIWLSLTPLRNLAQDHNSWISALPEAVAVGIFVGAVSSIFMQNIPMRFMDGYKVMKWNKAAWALQAAITAFLFWHVMINTSRSDFNAVSDTAPAVAIIAMVSCFVVTVALYTFFRFRQATLGAPA